jgi:hypothetical protein
VTLSEHHQWQRATALRHVERKREQAEQDGSAVTDRALAVSAAAYVDTTAERVLLWMKGAR